jgi:hypothetical protein
VAAVEIFALRGFWRRRLAARRRGARAASPDAAARTVSIGFRRMALRRRLAARRALPVRLGGWRAGIARITARIDAR